MFRNYGPVMLAALLLALSPSASSGDVWVTTKMLEAPPDEEGLMRRRTPDAWTFSSLKQANRKNVGEITRNLTHAIGPGPQQATPLAHSGILSLLNPGLGLRFLTTLSKTVAAPSRSKKIGRIDGMSVASGDHLWTHEQDAPWTDSLLTTSRGLLTGGDVKGRLKTFGVVSDKVLKEIPLGSATTGLPVSYEIEGRQYIVVTVRGGTILDFDLGILCKGGSSSEGSNECPARGNMLMVFVLPE